MQAAVLAALLLAAGPDIASAGFRYVPPETLVPETLVPETAQEESVRPAPAAHEPVAKGRAAPGGTVRVPDPAPDRWHVHAGETLRQALARWGARAGTDVLFLTDRRYRLERAVAFEGAFVDAVRTLMGGLSHLPRPPETAFAADGASLTVTHRAAKREGKGDGR